MIAISERCVELVPQKQQDNIATETQFIQHS